MIVGKYSVDQISRSNFCPRLKEGQGFLRFIRAHFNLSFQRHRRLFVISKKMIKSLIKRLSKEINSEC